METTLKDLTALRQNHGEHCYHSTPIQDALDIIAMVATSERFAPNDRATHIKSYLLNWLTTGDLIRLYTRQHEHNSVNVKRRESNDDQKNNELPKGLLGTITKLATVTAADYTPRKSALDRVFFAPRKTEQLTADTVTEPDPA